MRRLHPRLSPTLWGGVSLAAALVLGGPATRVQAAPVPPQSRPSSPGDEGSTTDLPASTDEPPSGPTPQTELGEAVCEPACPVGSACHDGQCFIACDPAKGECGGTGSPEPLPVTSNGSDPRASDETDANDDPEPQPVVPNALPASAEADASSPEPADPIGLGLRIAPTLGMCTGFGCRQIRVGSAAGGMSLGGGLDLRLSYRATAHLSLEVGGLATIHGNDIDADPLTMWLATLAGPRLHLSGGRWRVEPVLGFGVGYVRSLVRWSDAGMVADGLALSADAGILVPLGRRVSLGALTGALIPYWTRICDADVGITDCYTRSELSSNDLRRSMWTTSIAILIHFS